MPTPQDAANHIVTQDSTDEQLNAKAGRCAYNMGVHGWILYQIFSLQRDVARLKVAQAPAHMQDVEKRG